MPQPFDAYGNPVPALTAGTTQTVGLSATSAATTNPIATQAVRLVADVDCHIIFAGTPTATTGDMFLPASVVEYFDIEAPGTTKIAGIRNVADGTLYVTEMS